MRAHRKVSNYVLLSVCQIHTQTQVGLGCCRPPPLISLAPFSLEQKNRYKSSSTDLGVLACAQLSQERAGLHGQSVDQASLRSVEKRNHVSGMRHTDTRTHEWDATQYKQGGAGLHGQLVDQISLCR